MKEILGYVASLIVNEKDKVAVRELDDGMIKKYIVKVSKNDVKNIIGREGKTIKAIRSLISMASINKGIKKKIPVEIVDEDGWM
jgi:predicted RNA-binding protein YlqC (UPF0109 family)